MSVGITGGDSLKFVAELEIKEFEKNADKMEAAITAATKAAADGTERQIQTANKLKTAMSDTAKEVEAYKESVLGLAAGRVASNGTDEYIRLLDKDLKAGIITAKQYEAELTRIASIKPTVSNNAPMITEQTGLLEKQRAKLVELKEEQEKTTNVAKLGEYNVKIDQVTANIKRLTNAGKNGFDDMGNRMARSIERPIGQYNRLTAAAKLYENAARTSTNPILIEKYNRKLQETQVQIGKVSNIGKTGFDAVGNAIKGTQNPLQKALAGLLRMAYILPGIGVAGLIAFVADPIIAYVQSLNLFTKKLSETEEQHKSMLDAMKATEYTEAIASVSELRINVDLAKKSMFDKKAVVKQYNETIGLTAGAVKTLDEVEKGLVANGDAYIKMTLYKAAAQLALEKAATKALEAQEIRLKKSEDVASFGDKGYAGLVKGAFSSTEFDGTAEYENDVKIAGARRRKADAAEADKGKKQFEKIATNFQKQAADQAQKMGGILGLVKPDKVKKESEAYINAAENLKKRVADIGDEYTRKALTKDESELQAVRDKFSNITNEVLKFNADPKNKIKVNIDGLAAIGEAALADLRYRQDTEYLKIKLDKDKKLYTEFEQYKLNFGAEAARFKFGADLDYIKTLEEEKAKFSNKIDLTGPEIEKLTDINKRIDAAIEEKADKEEKAFLDAFNAAKTHAQKIFDIEKDYQTKVAALGATASEAQIAVLQKTRDANIANVLADELTASESWVKLFNNLDDLTAGEIDKLIKEIESKFSALSLKFPGVDMHKIVDDLKRAKDVLIKDNPFKQVGVAIKSIFADSADGAKDSTGKIKTDWTNLSKSTEASFAFVNDAVNSAGFLKDAIGDVGATALATLTTVAIVSVSVAAAIKTAERASVILAIIQAVLAVAQAIANILSLGKKAREAARKEIKDFYDTANAGETEYQALIRERAREQAKNHATNMAGMKAEQALLLGQGSDISKQSADLMKQLQAQQYVSSTTYRKGSLFRKASTTQNFESLAGKSFADIEQLAAQGKLTESAKKLFEELVKLKSEGADVEQALLDAGKAAAELATGTNVDSLSDKIIQSLRDGKTGLTDVMSDYSEIIQNALLSTFESEVVKKELSAFYAKLSAAAESDGLITVAEKDALAKEYTDMRLRIQKEADAYSAVTGANFADPTKSAVKSELSGAIKGITETQADLLAGQFGGLRLTAIAQLNIATKSLEVHVLNEQNTRRLHEVVPILKAIQTAAEKNTTGVLAANGKG